MTARIFIMPGVGIIRPLDAAWLEQRRAEQMAQDVNRLSPPERTRPLLVCCERRRDAAAFTAEVFAAADQILRERRFGTAMINIPFD